jgi:hypothetical protein
LRGVRGILLAARTLFTAVDRLGASPCDTGLMCIHTQLCRTSRIVNLANMLLF